MKLLKKIINSKGAAFLMALFILVIMVGIGVSGISMINQDLYIIKRLKQNMEVQFLAEAGISEAFAVLLDSGFSAKDNPSNFPLRSLGSGTYDVTVLQPSGRVLLSSEGVITTGGVKQTVIVEVYDASVASLSNALAGGNDIDLKANQGSITIKGNIHGNNACKLTEEGPATLISVEAQGGYTGKATGNNDYQISGNVNIADAANSGNGRPIQDLPTIDFASIKSVAQTDGNYIGSDTDFDGDSITGGSAGITYVDSTAKFDGVNTITGGFVAANDIELYNGASITQTHDAGNRFPIFMSQNSIKLYGTFSSEDGNLVYAMNDVTIETTGGAASAIVGAVIAGNSLKGTLNSDITFTFSQIIASEVVPGGLEIVSWNR